MGHIPIKISSVYYAFLGKTGSTITGTVTGSGEVPSCTLIKLQDHPQRGSVIPWVMKFAGDKIMVNKPKSLLLDMRQVVHVCSHTLVPSPS